MELNILWLTAQSLWIIQNSSNWIVSERMKWKEFQFQHFQWVRIQQSLFLCSFETMLILYIFSDKASIWLKQLLSIHKRFLQLHAIDVCFCFAYNNYWCVSSVQCPVCNVEWANTSKNGKKKPFVEIPIQISVNILEFWLIEIEIREPRTERCTKKRKSITTYAIHYRSWMKIHLSIKCHQKCFWNMMIAIKRLEQMGRGDKQVVFFYYHR